MALIYIDGLWVFVGSAPIRLSTILTFLLVFVFVAWSFRVKGWIAAFYNGSVAALFTLFLYEVLFNVTGGFPPWDMLPLWGIGILACSMLLGLLQVKNHLVQRRISMLLFSAFLEVAALKGVDLAKPEVFVGGFVGAMLIFLFSALAVKAVGRTSAEMIKEVRRQFREIPGLMQGTTKPDYSKCIDISTKSALRNMLAPSLLIVIGPIIVGLTLGSEAIGGLLMIGTIAGVLVALFMNNGGAALDNAKKFIEAGNLGGKGSAAHAAAVVGDTLGDPLKDTAGPSLHVVVKLLNTITLSMAPLFILYALLH